MDLLIKNAENEDMQTNYGEILEKKNARFILSAPDQCHPKLAGVFCILLVSPIRNLDRTIAIVFDSLYQRHCSNPQQLKGIISSCISLLLTKLHSESDYVQLFQFFLKCTSMVPGFRGDLWISGILLEAISNDVFVKSLIGELIDETISYIRSQSEFVYELHVVLATLCSLAVRSSMVRAISTKTLDSVYGYLEEISKREDQIGTFLQIFYGHYLAVLSQNDVVMELMKEESMLPVSLMALLEQFPKKQYKNISSSLSLIDTTLSGPLNCSTSFHIIPTWLKILKLICGKFWKKMGASKIPNLVTTVSSFRGLKNPSTICYGNSALQMLSKIPLFRNGFDRHCDSGESCGDLHKELKEVFDSLAAPLDEKVVDASDFIRKSRPHYFADWAHEDAQEYLGHLLGQLQAESTSKTSPASPSYISETFEGCQSRVSYCATCCEKIDKREDTFTTLMLPLKVSTTPENGGTVFFLSFNL
nr:expressed protein [Hymenolepis microstoma]